MWRLPILALLAAVAVAAGCGGGGSDGLEGTPPPEWAQEVCTALADWQSSLEQRSQQLTGTVLDAGSPEAAKEQIGTFLDEVIAETDALIEEVESAGAPAVEQGEAVAEEFRSGLREMRTAFEDAAAQVEEVPTDDPAAFQEQLTEIGRELQTQGETIGDRLGEIDEQHDADELTQAFEETPACAEFANGSAG